MNKEKAVRKQIIFKIDVSFHNELKVRAARRNISMNLWIIRALYRAMQKEDNPQGDK